MVTRSDAGAGGRAKNALSLSLLGVILVDPMDLFVGLTDLVGTVTRLLVGTWGGRSLMLIGLAALPIIAVATHK